MEMGSYEDSADQKDVAILSDKEAVCFYYSGSRRVRLSEYVVAARSPVLGQIRARGAGLTRIACSVPDFSRWVAFDTEGCEEAVRAAESLASLLQVCNSAVVHMPDQVLCFACITDQAGQPKRPESEATNATFDCANGR